MSKFEENLDDSISKVLNEAKLSDELYQKYVQYVGALDALPQDQIAVDRLGSDIHDQFGRVKPFSQWPTKSTRAKSERVWLTYNQRLQLAQAAKEGGTAPEDPTDDPDFLSQLLDTCVRTCMSTGSLDRKTAFRHCSKQVQRFEQAIRGALADRGLPKKEAEEFTKELLKGMANGKQIDLKDLSVEDRQFIQDLKDSLTYKPKSESIVKEDLDDKDEFGDNCHFFGCYQREDNTEFHLAHDSAHQAAFLTGQEALKKGILPKEFQPIFHKAFVDTMAKHGYKEIKNSDGFGNPDFIKEDLDDKDEFKPECDVVQGESGNACHLARKLLEEGYNYGGEYHEVPPESVKVGDLDLKVGDWVELGPKKTSSIPNDVLDDKDEFGGQEDFPITPVQVNSISDVTKHYRNQTESMFLVRLSNSNLLSLPDKSGVRWHGRPKHHVPSWYQEWYAPFTDDVLKTYWNQGELRKVDNIEEWFQSQPVKEEKTVRGWTMCDCGSKNLKPIDYPYGHPGTAVKCEDCSNVMYGR